MRTGGGREATRKKERRTARGGHHSGEMPGPCRNRPGVTPQCGVAICRLALSSPSLTLSPLPSFPRSSLLPSFQLLGCIYEASPGIGSALSEGRTKVHQQEALQVRPPRTGGGGMREGVTRGRGPREERLTRRDQRRDSCPRRVSPRRLEGPRETSAVAAAE